MATDAWPGTVADHRLAHVRSPALNQLAQPLLRLIGDVAIAHWREALGQQVTCERKIVKFGGLRTALGTFEPLLSLMADIGEIADKARRCCLAPHTSRSA